MTFSIAAGSRKAASVSVPKSAPALSARMSRWRSMSSWEKDEGRPKAFSKTWRSGLEPRTLYQLAPSVPALARVVDLAAEVHREAHVVVGVADGHLEGAGLVGVGDRRGEAGVRGVGAADVAEAEGVGEPGVGLVGQAARQRLGVGGAFLEDLADEGLLVDLAVEAEGAERHLEQAAVGDEVGGGGDRADLLLEVFDVLLDLRRLVERGLLGGLGALEKAPAGNAGEWNHRLEAHRVSAAGLRPRSRASRGIRARRARITW